MSAERWSKNSNRWRNNGGKGWQGSVAGCHELKMEFSSCHPDCCMKLRRCEMLVIVYEKYVIIADVWWCILMTNDMLCKTNINSITEPTAPRDPLKVTSKERLIYCINTRTFMQKTGREDEHYEFRWGQDKIPEQEPLNCECNTLTTSPPRLGGDCSKKHSDGSDHWDFSDPVGSPDYKAMWEYKPYWIAHESLFARWVQFGGKIWINIVLFADQRQHLYDMKYFLALLPYQLAGDIASNHFACGCLGSTSTGGMGAGGIASKSVARFSRCRCLESKSALVKQMCVLK